MSLRQEYLRRSNQLMMHRGSSGLNTWTAIRVCVHMLMSVCTMGIATLHASIAHESLAKKKKNYLWFLGDGRE